MSKFGWRSYSLVCDRPHRLQSRPISEFVSQFVKERYCVHMHRIVCVQSFPRLKMAKQYECHLIDANGVEHGYSMLEIGNDEVKFGTSIQLQYTQIVLHAICTDLEFYPKPCIYCQIEKDNGEDMDELRFVPKNPNLLQEIFAELSRCAALHPDENGDAEDPGMGFEGVGMDEIGEEFFDASTSEEKLRLFEKAFVEPKGMPPPAASGQFDEVDEADEEEDL
jgi:hypothetical protein